MTLATYAFACLSAFLYIEGFFLALGAVTSSINGRPPQPKTWTTVAGAAVWPLASPIIAVARIVSELRGKQ